MKLTPRYYQNNAVYAIWDYFNSGKKGNPIVAMPTGTGKSIVIGDFVRSIYHYYPSQRVMMLTHIKELIEQNFEKLLQLWPNAPAGIYSAGLNRKDLYNNITFAGIGSVAKKAELFGHIDIIIIDEAHLVSPNDTTMYRKFINALMKVNPHLKIVGFTATAYRLGHGKIIEGEDSLFTDICYDITTLDEFNKLIDEGFISTLVPKNTNLLLDTDGVHKRAGEFIAKELQDAVDKTEITEAAVREAIEIGEDRNSWLVFTSGVEHAIHTAEILNDLGIPALAVHGGNKTYKMTGKERDQAILDFKKGKVRALVNNNILTTGFDHPAIDLILMLRPTSSPGLWVQMLGRGTRPLYMDGFDLTTIEGRLASIAAGPKQDCMVLDFGGNTKRLGPINDPVLPAKKGKKTGDAPVKLCEAVNGNGKICDTWIHASLKFCPECGNEFIFKTKIKQGASTDELIKSDLPIVEEFIVDHITFAIHTKIDKPPMMKVSYYSGLKVFTDYVCFEHEGYALMKAKKWWKARTDLDFPKNTNEGLRQAESIDLATSLRVWTNKKYPEIMEYDFTGTHFGKDQTGGFEPTMDAEQVTSEGNLTINTPDDPKFCKSTFNAEPDDDIPF